MVNISGNNGAVVSFNFSTEMDFGNISIIINTSAIGIRNLEITVNGTNQTSIVGFINGTQLFIDRITGNLNNITLNFERAGSKTFNINMSVKSFLGGNFSFKAQSVNKDQIDYQQNFTNASYINASTSNGDYINFSYENFNDNRTDLWNFVLSNEIQPSNGLLATTASCGQGTEELAIANMKNMNISRFDKIKFKVRTVASCNSQGGSGSGTIAIALTSNDEGTIFTEFGYLENIQCAPTQVVTREKNITLTNLGNNQWRYNSEAGTATITMSGDDINFQIRNAATCNSGDPVSVSMISSIYEINVSGIGNRQLTNQTYNTSFNYTSTNLLNVSGLATGNVISALIDSIEVDEKFGDALFLYYLSTDGTTWENVQKNQLHVFNTQGTKLFARIVGNSTNSSTPFGISRVNIRTSSEQLENVSFDFGQDGIFNVFVGGVINETNGSFSKSPNATFEINNYLFSGNCTGKTCLLPVTVTSQSPGILVVFNLSLEQKLNNISLNSSSIEKLCKNNGNCNIIMNFTSNSTEGIVNITNLSIEYKGNALVNLTLTNNVSDTVLSTINIIVRYSKFNITSPSPFFAFFPQNNNTKYLQPFGQNNRTNISIFNFTNLASTDPITIWLRLNQSLNSCLSLYASNQSNLDNQKIVNTSYNKYIENISVQGNKSMYFFLNLTQCKPSTIAIQDPYNFFEGACEGCYQTWLK